MGHHQRPAGWAAAHPTYGRDRQFSLQSGWENLSIGKQRWKGHALGFFYTPADRRVTHRSHLQPLTGHSGRVYGMAFSPDGKILASISDGGVVLWNVATHSLIGQPITEYKYLVPGLAFSPDGKFLVFGTQDRVIILNTATGNLVNEIQGYNVSSVASSDSRGLARALTGKTEGAIEDFQDFINWTDYGVQKSQREHWIEALQAGNNPFTPEELEKLRRQ